MALLCVTLSIGPLNVLRGRPNPVSTYLRRDVGIWAGGLSLLHVGFGLNAHLRGRPWEYFIAPIEGGGVLRVRLDAFGLANYTGLGATLVVILLLALSNDLSLRKYGRRRWKALQRWNYGAFALIVAHGVVYQFLEGRPRSWSMLLAALVLLTVGLQILGLRKRAAGGR